MKIREHALTFFLFLTAIQVSKAAIGDLDTSFAGTGFTRTKFGFGDDFGRAMTLQPDGKLIVAGNSGVEFLGGNFSMVRFTTNDTLDASFGAHGKVITPVGGTNFSQANAVRIQSDGKIILAGIANNSPSSSDVAIVRYNADGSLDTSFGTNGNGIVKTDIGLADSANGMFINSEGKIIVAGSSSGNLFVARYDTNGMLDTSFDGDGIAIKDTAANIGALAMTLQADGKILVTGSTLFHTGVFRFLTNGLPDSTFDGDGMVVITNGIEGSSGNAITIQSGGAIEPDRIVIAGYGQVAFATYSISVIRLDLDGTPDSTFDGDGKVLTSLGSGFQTAQAVLVQRSGLFSSRIIVAGYVFEGSQSKFAVVKYFLGGTPDNVFDMDGIVTTPIGAANSFGQAALFQSGRILVAGYVQTGNNNNDFAMVRYNLSSGLLDTTYDDDGIKTQDVAEREAYAQDVVIQPDGKSVVVGYSSDGDSRQAAAIARYNSDGTPDTTFGELGKLLPFVSALTSEASAVAIQPDGKIVVAGSASTNDNSDFMVLRLLENGTLDDSFDGDGIAMTQIGTSTDVAYDVTLQPNGRIVAVGSSHNGTDTDFAAVRYHTNGSLDMSFDGDGKATTAIASGDDDAASVAIQPDGKIILAGTGTFTGPRFAMIRYNTNGTLDNSFGSFGRVATEVGVVSRGFGMALQPDGKIVVGGVAAVSQTEIDMALLRYLTNGFPDNSFSGDGQVTTAIGLASEFGHAVALQPDGKILLAGFAAIGADNEFAIVRYLTNGTPDPDYGINGKAVHDISTGPSDVSHGIALDARGRAVVVGEANGTFGVLRLLGDPFLSILSVTKLPNGHAMVEGIGVPGTSHTLFGSTNLTTGSFNSIGPVSADVNGDWQFDDAGAMGLDMRYYRLTLP
jgi:uncharacterized delta-60 repeat protein